MTLIVNDTHNTAVATHQRREVLKLNVVARRHVRRDRRANRAL